MRTLDDYTFDLRQGLRDAACVGLSQLEEMMGEVGYAWLDGYMESILENEAKAPIMELIKTPSRKQTVKKTRAVTTAMKERTDKLKALNLQSGSPFGKSTRQALSPLQPGLLNPPISVFSSVSANAKGKKTTASPVKKPKSENKRKKATKAKTDSVSDDVPSSKSSSSKQPGAAQVIDLASPVKSKPSTSKSASSKPQTPPAQEPARSPSPEITVEPVERAAPIHGDAPIEDTMHISAPTDSTDIDFDDEPEPTTSPPKEASESSKVSKAHSPISLRSVPTPTSAPSQPESKPSGPVRQVRSSWLRQALGTGTVPVAATTQRPPQVDFTLRKSLMLAAGLGTKRPSDGAEEEAEKRPEKVFKFDGHQSSVALGGHSHTPGPSAVPLPTSAPHETASSSQLGRGGDRHRSDINKVTKALDELRERAAAKEAQKQKAGTIVPRNTLHDRQSTAGGGFLRGIGSIGSGLGKSLGLGGTARSAEEEALRLQAELEEDRLAELEAQAELDRLMGELKEPQSPASREKDREDKMDVDANETRSAALTKNTDRDQRATTVELEDESIVAGALESDGAPMDREVESVAPVRSSPPRSTTPLAPCQTTPAKQALDIFESTTPMGSPPKRTFMSGPGATRLKSVEPLANKQPAAAGTKFRPQVITPNDPVPQPEEDQDEGPVDLPPLPEPEQDEVDDERTDLEDDEEGEELREMPAKKMFKSDTDVGVKGPRHASTSSVSSLASSSQLAQSVSSGGMLSHASMIAGKALGFKPTVGPVKSVQLANAAAKKEHLTAERKAQIRAEGEARRAEAARKKEEAEKAKLEEDRRVRAAELEEKRRIRAEAEKRRKEREEKIAIVAREKAAKEEAEKAAVKAKAEEEMKKRKMAQAALNKTGSATKKVAPGMVKSKDAGSSQGQGAGQPLRTIKPVGPLASSMRSGSVGPSKLGPTSFRSAETVSTTSTAVITAVNPSGQPRVLGPPSRPSQLAAGHAKSSIAFAPNPAPSSASVLQQSRAQLQSALDEKALAQESEDIVLPDIASEYSDSDDSDKEDDFKRPAWAESPELRSALQAQATRNPDDLFGPIKPLNMEELFKVKTGKFRARTSSANWNGGDRLTKAEELDYARRMGFRPINAPGASASGGP